jgi:8-oxo-dGTP pyrophosphatase MutT (NUDIX family)
VSSPEKRYQLGNRVDYWDDPAAPKPTSRKPSASALVRDDEGRVLLLRRTDTGTWTLPTGGLKKAETLTQCAIRETLEETGIHIEVTGMVGVFSDPRHVIAYADGEVRQPVNVCLHARPVGGRATATAEASEVRWVEPGDLDGYEIHPAQRRRIDWGLAHDEPWID